MNKKKKKELVPALRFPKFKNAKSWEEKKLDEVAEINPKDFELPHQFVYIDLESVENGTLLKKRIIKSEDAPSRAQRLLKENDIIFQMVRPYQKNNYYYFQKDDLEYVASTGYAQIRSIRSSLYLYYFLHTDNFVTNVLTKCTGSNYPAISSSDLAKLIIQIPEIKEQQKIAECLSSIDETIQSETEKLEQLKEHKSGLTQHLFPQEGQKIPKYRFRELRNDGEWNQEMLGEIATFYKGKGVSKADIAEDGRLPCIRYGELYTHYNEVISEVHSYTNLNREDLFFSEKNDVIIPASGETHADIATAACVTRDGIALGGDLNILRPNIDGIFLSYYINSNKKREISQLAQGYSVVHLYPTQLKNLIIKFPNKKEQNKIASCLSSLDDLITAQKEKIELLGQHKKGLMQGLFP